MRRIFTEAQLAVLKHVQCDLPDSIKPYERLARLSGMEEGEVIRFLQDLKDEGIIRRFGASIRHYQSGWKYNAMVAWKADENEAEKWSDIIESNPGISHAYYRPSGAADWPYQLYTMIHGQKPGDIEKVIMDLLARWPFTEYVVLDTIRELKKISMTYFD